MKQKYLALPSLLMATLILAISVHKSTSVKYVFSQEPSPMPVNARVASVDYHLPDPDITPDSVLWPVKAIADSTETSSTALLESADFRLVVGMQMIDNQEFEEGVVVLEKAEQYLKKSYESALKEDNNLEILEKISWASLKHREVLETILLVVPEDGRAMIAKTLNASKTIYEESAFILQDSGLTPPSNPF